MSVETLGVVLHHSRATGTDKLVLIGIANHAGDGGAWPSRATLAKYANVSERSVKRSLHRLVELGEVDRHLQAGGLADMDDHARPNRYDVLVTCPEGCAGGQQHRPRPGWTYDSDLREYVRQVDDAGQAELSTNDTPGTQNPATRRKQGGTHTSPGDAQDTPGGTHTSPEPSCNHPSVAESVTELQTARARAGRDCPQLDDVRASLRDASARHRAREHRAYDDQGTP